MSQSRPTLQQRRRRQSEREIADAALTLFETQGVQATSVEEIAGAAGISVRTVFRYFGRKEDTALVAHAELRSALQEAVESIELDEDPIAQVLGAYALVFDELAAPESFILDALERVDRLKHREPALMQAGLRVDAEQTMWLAEQLTRDAKFTADQASIIADVFGLLFRNTLQHWADGRKNGDSEASLRMSFEVVSGEYFKLSDMLRGAMQR